MTVPHIGDIVYYYTLVDNSDPPDFVKNAAVITKTHTDTNVNLTIFPDGAATYTVPNVSNTYTGGAGGYWDFMPT